MVSARKSPPISTFQEEQTCHRRKSEGQIRSQEQHLGLRERDISGQGEAPFWTSSRGMSSVPPVTPESDRAHSGNGGGRRRDTVVLASGMPTAATYLSCSPGMLSLGGLQLQGHVMASGNCCWEGLRGRRQEHQDVVRSASGARLEPGSWARPHALSSC